MRLSYSYFFPSTAPNPNVFASIANAAGIEVGKASFGVSPLFDCVYIYTLDIELAQQRQGYGKSFLMSLARQYGCDLIPVSETSSAEGFWDKVRTLDFGGHKVRFSISGTDLLEEKNRWPHLHSEAERLKAIISDRIPREGFDAAVARGFDC